MEILMNPSFAGTKSAYKIKKKQISSHIENPTKLDHVPSSSKLKSVLEELNAKRPPPQTLNGNT